MHRADVVGDDARIFEVDGVLVHADGERLDGAAELARRDGADEGGIQPAREEEPDGRVRIQPLAHPLGQFDADIAADGIDVVGEVFLRRGNIGIAVKSPLIIVVSGREGADLPLCQSDEVFGFAGKEDRAVGEVPVIEGADADGVARGDVLVLLPVVEHEGKLGVEHGEHLGPVFAVKGEQDLAVAVRREGIAELLETALEGTETVDLAVADELILAHGKGLHARRVQAHDGQAVEGHVTGRGALDAAHIRPARDGAIKAVEHLFIVDFLGRTAENGTHDSPPNV